MKTNERGDVVLVITIGTLIVLGVSSLVSVILPKTNQSTKSKAAEPASCTTYDRGTCGHCLYRPELDCRTENGGTQTDKTKCCQDLGCDGIGGTEDKACDKPYTPSYNTSDCKANTCCKMDSSRKIIKGSETQSCDKPNKCDIDGNCNKDCCGDDSDCSGGAKCYKNGNGYCQTESVCSGGTGGGNDTVPTNNDKDGDCFSMSVVTYADKEGDGYRFNAHVKLHDTSPGVGKGHMWFTYDGSIEKPDICCWRGGNDDYDLGMQNLDIQGPLLTSGSKSVNYSIRLPACGGAKQPKNQTQSISCLYSIVNGKPKVEGPGCSCSPTTPCTTESGPSTTTTTTTTTAKCKTSKGTTIPADGKSHCAWWIDAKTYAVCETGKDKATETACPGTDVCKANKKGTGGGDGCEAGGAGGSTTTSGGTGASCTSSNGKTIARDDKIHCINDKTYAQCKKDSTDTTPIELPCYDKVCKIGGGKDGNDICVEETTTKETCTPVACPADSPNKGTSYYKRTSDGKYYSKDKECTDTKSTEGKTEDEIKLAACFQGNCKTKSGEYIAQDKKNHCLKDNKTLAKCPDTGAGATETDCQATGMICQSGAATSVEDKCAPASGSGDVCTNFIKVGDIWTAKPKFGGGFYTDVPCGNNPGATFTEECDGIHHLASGRTQAFKGTRYVKVLCGGDNGSCIYKCKYANEPGSNNYTGDCSVTDDYPNGSGDPPSTCLDSSVIKETAKVNIKVKLPSSCAGRSVFAIGYDVMNKDTNNNVVAHEAVNANASLQVTKTFTFSYNKLPERTIKIKTWINILDKNGSFYSVYEPSGDDNWEEISSTSVNNTITKDFNGECK